MHKTPTESTSSSLSHAAAMPLVSPQQEARAFWRMRLHLATAVLRQALRAGRLRIAMVIFLSGLLWGALFWLFYEGFHFLNTTIPSPDIYDQTVQSIFGKFFFALMAMLVFSSAVILYAAVFRGRDIPFLLTLPARPERVFLAKLQEAILMASWAFLLLGSPMLIAYGLVARAPWHYYAMLLPYLIAFTYIPSSFGAILCLGIVDRLPNRRWHILILTAVAAGMLVFGWWALRVIVVATQGSLITPNWFLDMLGRFSFSENRLLPSWWLSTGLLQASQWGDVHLSDAAMFLALTISNALFFRQVALWIAALAYRRAYNGLHGLHKPRPRARVAWIDRLARGLSVPFSRPMRQVLLKDFRLFRRDPIQWLQIVILMGLMAVYYLYLPTLSSNPAHSQWLSVVSFLNLSVVGLLLSTFTTRFIFPMISLEGRRFWIVGLLPVRRDTILWSKFVFAVGASLVPSSLLILTSDLALRVPPLLLVSHQFVCVILCFGLSGIAVGLGARMPNSREESPARIAAGFGGTLNLVLGTLYILVVVLLTTLPCHFYLSPQGPTLPSDSWFSRFIVRWIDAWVWGGTLGSVLLGAVATFVPLIVGLRAFRRAEF